MEKNKLVKRNNIIPKPETKIDIAPPKIKKITSGVYHNGEKTLYEQPPDEEWNCCGCMNCDKDLIIHLTKVGISSAVLGFCMVMLMNAKGDSAFYSSTISLILGTFLGSQVNTQSNNNKN